VAELLTQIARTEGLQRNFKAAHRTLDRAESLLTDDMPRAKVRYLLERGRAFNSSRHPDEARPLFLSAWESALESGEEYLAVDAAHMMGIVEDLKGQLEWGLRALEMTERSVDPRTRSWLGSLYNNIGWTYHDLGRYDEALNMFERSLAWRRSQNQPRETRIAAWTIARTLRSLGRYDEALDIQRENLVRAAELGDSDGFIQEEIGECLLALGRAEEAKPHFAKAYAALSQDPWIAESEPDRVERLGTLGTQ
jgi:tetratricopeptide (TPR) repeat protein